MINEFKCFWYVDGTHDDWPMTIEADGMDIKSITIPVRYENGESEVLRFVRERTCHDRSKRGMMFRCTECGCRLFVTDETLKPTVLIDEVASVPKFCPGCGAKVVDE